MTIKCVIYTRKSTEHGLDMEFNSLQNQEEACKAYICDRFGGIGHMVRYTLVMLLSKIAGNGATKNIPWDCHGMSNFTGGDEGIV